MSLLTASSKFKRWAPALVLGAIPFITACSDDDDDNVAADVALPTITDIATSTDRFSNLAAAVSSAGLAPTLDSDGAYTVFAPNNAAFTDLLTTNQNGWNELSDIPLSTLYGVLRYHVLATKVESDAAITAASNNDSVTTLGGEDLALSLDGETLKVNNASVIAADVQASNGVVHEINSVLLPRGLPTVTIAAAAQATPGLSTLYAAVLSANGSVATTLSSDGNLTVFAPSDSAFNDFLASDLATSNNWSNVDDIPDNILTDVLNYHVLTSFVPSELAQSVAVSDMPVVDTALADASVSVSLSDELYINNAAVTTANVLATNGVVHIIDKVLVPPKYAVDTSNDSDSIAAIATAASQENPPELSTLLAAVSAAGLAQTLSDAGTFTVFAPTDAAFAKINLNASNVGSTPDLQNILLQHVFASEVSSLEAFAVNGADVPTLRDGASLTVEIKDGDLLVEGSKVIETDIKASNGIIHLIDTVILETN